MKKRPAPMDGRWRLAAAMLPEDPGREMMPLEIKDALTIMISFGGLIIALLTLMVAIVAATEAI